MKEKLKILLVDDDEQFLNALAKRSDLKGYEALTATSSKEAVAIARIHTIEIAVVDLRLPDLDGLATITKLKEIQPELRTILLTAHGSEKLKEATEALQSAYFEKQDMSSFWEFLGNIPFKQINILVVDDDEKLLGVLAKRLEIKGYRIFTATRGGEAFEVAKREQLHVAVVDLRLPDTDGLVVITKLKEIHPKIQTVLLTGHGDDKLREATEALNTAYFEKIDMGSFWGFIRRTLRKLETTMAVAGMASGGDTEDAIKIHTKSNGDE